MSAFGKILGACAGWVLAGPIGGLFGFALGTLIDNISDMQPKQAHSTARNDFALCLLVLIASVMKADGVIKRSELDFVKDYLKRSFGVDAAQEMVLKLRDILQQNIPVEDVCMQIRDNMDYSSRLELLHLLYGVAASDNDLDPSELNLISYIARYLGISDADNLSIKSMFDSRYSSNSSSASLESEYAILEVDSSATDDEIKRAYKKMAIKYHPDKVSYLGEEAQQTATQKFKKVNEAYEKIKKARGIK